MNFVASEVLITEMLQIKGTAGKMLHTGAHQLLYNNPQPDIIFAEGDLTSLSLLPRYSTLIIDLNFLCVTVTVLGLISNLPYV